MGFFVKSARRVLDQGKLCSPGFLCWKVRKYYLVNIPVDMDQRGKRLDRVRALRRVLVITYFFDI